MKVLTKTQLALIFLALAGQKGDNTSLIINSIVTNQIIFEAQERVKDHLSSARWVYSSKLREIDRTIRWASVRHVLKRAIKERNVSPIRNELTELMKEEGLDFLTLVDKKGAVLFRFHHPEQSGDSLLRDPFIQKGVEKKTVVGTQI